MKSVGRPRYNEAGHLIFALNKHMQNLEKQLDEKQIIIETLIETKYSEFFFRTTLLLMAIIKKIKFLLKISTRLIRKLK